MADRVGVDVGVDLEAGLGELAVAGVLAGAAALLLAVALLGGLGDREGDVVLGAAVVEDLLGGVLDGDPCRDPRARAGEAFVELGDGGESALDALVARGLVALLLGAGVHPDDAVPLAGGKRRGRDLPDLVGVAVALAGPARRLGELRGGGAHPVAQLGVLAPRAWQHGDEPAAGLVDVAHLLARAQLAVGDVEEVGAAGQRAQLVPRVDVRLVVVGVAGRQAMRRAGRRRRRSRSGSARAA